MSNEQAPKVQQPRLQYFTQPNGKHRTYVFATLYNNETHMLSIGEAVFTPDDKDPRFTRRKYGAGLQKTAIARLHKRPVEVEYVRPDEAPPSRFNTQRFHTMRNAVARANAERKRVKPLGN